jgi:hypothetical protein
VTGKQSRADSLMEALTNIAIGLTISTAANQLFIPLATGHAITLRANVVLGVIYTGDRLLQRTRPVRRGVAARADRRRPDRARRSRRTEHRRCPTPSLPDLFSAISSPASASGASPCAQAGWPDDEPIWTGSCPCQPFSAAGKGGGFADERHLWPAFHWLIEQCRPELVLGEQVASKDGLRLARPCIG